MHRPLLRLGCLFLAALSLLGYVGDLLRRSSSASDFITVAAAGAVGFGLGRWRTAR